MRFLGKVGIVGYNLETIKVLIYSLTDPTNDEVRYIGRTKNSLSVRFRNHKSKAKRKLYNTHKDC